MKRIYGGYIGMPKDGEVKGTGSAPWFRPPGSGLMVNGRSAIDLIVKRLKPRNVWLPSYLCCTMITPEIKKRGYRSYGVDRYFEIDSSFISRVQSNDLVVFINYFGFRYPDALGEAVQQRGGWILEDSCMGLFTEPSPWSHFVVKSLTKNLGCPDGAIIYSNSFIDFAADTEGFSPPPKEWTKEASLARVGRRDYDLGLIDHKDWLKVNTKAKRLTPVGEYTTSTGVNDILHFSYNYDRMMGQQEHNYAVLESELKHNTVFSLGNHPGFPGGYFPIITMDRDDLQNRLFADNIFPAIHWRLPWKDEFMESRWLSSHLLSIPCDWRYDEDDMRHVADRVKKHLRHSK